MIDNETETETGKEEIMKNNVGDNSQDTCFDPFEKRSTILRTPPRARTNSMPDVELQDPSGSQMGNTNKRKRVENSPKGKEAEEKKGDLLKEIWKKMFGQILLLEKEVKAAYKMKKEIVDISSKLSKAMEKVRPEMLDDWAEMASSKERDREREFLMENDKLRRQIRVMEDGKKRDAEQIDRLQEENAFLSRKLKSMEDTESKLLESLIDPEDRCSKCLELRKLRLRRAELKQEDSFENFQEILEEDWASDIFPKPSLIDACIGEAPPEWDIILPCNKNFESDQDNVNKGIDKFGGKDGLKKQNKNEVGEVALMLHSLGFPEKNGTFTQNTRCIYYPILSESSAESDMDDAKLFEALAEIKSHLMEQKRYKVAVPQLGAIRGLMIVRMLRFLLADTPIELTIYKSQKPQRTIIPGQQQLGSKANKAGPNETNKRRNTPKQDAVLVSMRGKTYAELLKSIKTAVKPNELGVEVQNMKRTKNGDLILTIQNGADKAEILKKELASKVPEATASLLIRRKILHLKGMDETVNEDEIRDAVSKTFNIARDKFEVTALRPAYGGKQNATLKMLETDANVLLQAKSIRVGWTKARLIEREKITRCTKCWETGHVKADCPGPDRSELCLKCGETGHKISGCQNEPFCLTCNTKGHRTESKNCKSKGSGQLKEVIPRQTINNAQISSN